MFPAAAQPHARRETRAGASAVVAPLRAPRGGLRAWARAARIHQWVKNLLLFAAPLAAGALAHAGALARVALAFVAFCLLAGGAYLINDVCDAAEDRRHPVKRHRPIASGAVAPGHALAAGIVGIALGIGVAACVSWKLAGAAGGYALLNGAYTALLRQIAIADICAIAGAFVLRAVAGAIAAGVPSSPWFVVVVSFAALFVAAGKRYADFLDPAARRSRPVLEQYTDDFLRLVIGTAAAVALGAYCLWAFAGPRAAATPWRELTVAPFTVAMLRYGLLVSSGVAGAPEEVLLGDRFMQLAGAVWLAMLALGL
jgi:decaprenyl-phosphate phosphoribosyltransferase